MLGCYQRSLRSVSLMAAHARAFRCECGRRYSCSTSESARVTHHRCRTKHFSNEDIILDDGEIQPQNILWVILSHKDGRHNATTLRAELLQRGVASSLLVSKHGFSQSEAYDGDRQVQYNEITMYSFFFRWMQCAAHFLATTRRTIRCVMYLECTARCQFNHVSELLPLLNSRKRQPVKWLGYRKFHDPRPQRNRHDHPVVEGSKMIAFTRSSLSRVWNLQLKSKRYCHLDIWFSKTLGPKYLFVPEHSLTYSCKHLSVCGGSSTGPVVREREPPGRLPKRRKRSS